MTVYTGAYSHRQLLERIVASEEERDIQRVLMRTMSGVNVSQLQSMLQEELAAAEDQEAAAAAAALGEYGPDVPNIDYPPDDVYPPTEQDRLQLEGQTGVLTDTDVHKEPLMSPESDSVPAASKHVRISVQTEVCGDAAPERRDDTQPKPALRSACIPRARCRATRRPYRCRRHATRRTLRRSPSHCPQRHHASALRRCTQRGLYSVRGLSAAICMQAAMRIRCPRAVRARAPRVL